jgi:glutamate racemase
LVARVEAGQLDDEETVSLLRGYLAPLIEAGIDELVLGCTHYPFLRPAIARLVGPEVAIVDPAPAVARQTGRVLAQARPSAPRARHGKRTLYTSGSLPAFRESVARLVGTEGEVRSARWNESGRLVAP